MQLRDSLALTLQFDEIAAALRSEGWCAVPRALAVEQARRLREEAAAWRAAGGFRPAGVGRGEHWRLRPELRSDEVGWVDPAAALPAQAELLAAFERLRVELNARLLLGLFDYEAHLAVYPPGAFYRRHRDHFRGTEDRVLTTTLYLNENWAADDGGEIRLFLPDRQQVDILPEAGTLLLFLAQEFDHEVLVARRERWSWTGWMRQLGLAFSSRTG